MTLRYLSFGLALWAAAAAVNLSAQAPEINGLVNGASFDNSETAPPPGPGSIVSIFGTRLASQLAPSASTTLSVDTSLGIPLQTSLGGTEPLSEVSVTIDGVAVPMFALIRTPNFDQINAQVPWDADVADGVIDVTVTRDGQAMGSMSFPAADASPGIFTLQSGPGPAIVTNVAFAGGPADVINGSYAQAPGTSCAALGLAPNCGISEQAAPVGGAVTIWCNGLGPVDGAVENGDIPSPGPGGFAAVVKPLRVLIGGVEAPLLGAALSGQFVGLNQVNVVVPAVSPGNALPVQIEMNIAVGNQVRTVTTRADATMAVRAAP